MNGNLIQQEIFLVTGNGFSSRQLCERDSSQGLTPDNEKLKDACWNGLISEMIPELFGTAESKKKIFLWQIMEARFFILLEMGEFPSNIDKNFSIDPYYFLAFKSGN